MLAQASHFPTVFPTGALSGLISAACGPQIYSDAMINGRLVGPRDSDIRATLPM